MSYQDDAGRLARALTDLLGAGPPPQAPAPHPPLTALQAQAALVCRDTVVGAVRDLTGALLGPTPPLLSEVDLPARSPVHALHAALRDLPPATGRTLTLTDALAVQAPMPVAGWQSAARAAATLEAYRDGAAALPGRAAWSLARDLATLSLALPALDVDLAASTAAVTVPDSTTTITTTSPPPNWADVAAAQGGPAAALLDGPSHGLLQLSATELAAHTADVPPAAAALPGRPREPTRPVNDLVDLPAASRQLADLLHRRGDRITVIEVRAAARIVVQGVDLLARTLTGQPPTALTPPGHRTQGSSAPVPASALGNATGGATADDAPGGDAAGPDLVSRAAVDAAVSQLRRALPDLQHLLHAELGTLTVPAPDVLQLAQQMQHQLTVAARQHPPPAAGPSPALHEAAGQAAPDRAAPGQAGRGEALAQWAVTAAPVVEAVLGGLRAAAASGSLLAPRRDSARGPEAHLVWLRVRHTDEGPHPALQATERAAQALRDAATSLAGLLGPAATGRPAGAPRAAADAAAAFGELTAALQTRPPTTWPNPTRTAHPALPRATGQPQRPPRR